MTRINCVPVTELVDKHLVAEYRELPRIFAMVRDPKHNETFPKTYTLGAGHMKFFYDKLTYLAERQKQLVAEMIRRGFKPSFTAEELVIKYAGVPGKHWHDWTPTPEAMAINRERLAERIATMTSKKL